MPPEKVSESFDIKPEACRCCGAGLLGDDPEPLLSVVATSRQQNRNVLELLTAWCAARLDGTDAPSLLPAEAELAAA